MSDDTAKREGVVGILKKVHPRHVIWGLLVGIFVLLGFIGKKYDERLEAVETHIKTQNGHLQDLVTEQRVIQTDITWMKSHMGNQ